MGKYASYCFVVANFFYQIIWITPSRDFLRDSDLKALQVGEKTLIKKGSSPALTFTKGISASPRQQDILTHREDW